MRVLDSCYVGGQWVGCSGAVTQEVINPATEEPAGRVTHASGLDVNMAVDSARSAFEGYSRTGRGERLELLESVLAEYRRRASDLADAVTEEMGAPAKLAINSQVGLSDAQFATAAAVLRDYPFDEESGTTRISREPIGVCALITPWNWPLNQIACKVAPALATGCTMILKPSEFAPFSARVLAEVLHAAGVPAGVFNLVYGDGRTVGSVLSSHPLVDLVSITGSTSAGTAVAMDAAPTVKRVLQQLSGKSPFIVFDDDELARGVAACVASAMNNSGQSCNAPALLLVPARRLKEATTIAAMAVGRISVGAPAGDADMGPVATEAQWNRVQALIRTGIEEGATLITGGLGKPAGLTRGFYVKPTVFSDVTKRMTIARKEIFGPVLSIVPYAEIDDAIEIGNGGVYGLAAYVYGADRRLVREVAGRLRAGQIRLNGAPGDLTAPFGGFKRSGNGREWGAAGFTEFVETKSIMGFHQMAEEAGPR